MQFDLYSDINKINIIREDRNTSDYRYFLKRPTSSDEIFVNRIRAAVMNKK